MAFEWKGQMCPILSSGVVTVPEESRIVALGGAAPKKQDMNVLPCQGPACAWYMTMRDERGVVVDGHCATLLGAAALGNLVNIGQMLMVRAAQESGAQAATPAVIPNKKA